MLFTNCGLMYLLPKLALIIIFLIQTHPLVSDQHAAVVILGKQALGVVHKLWADVATVDLHTLLHLHLSLSAACVTRQGCALLLIIFIKTQ